MYLAIKHTGKEHNDHLVSWTVSKKKSGIIKISGISKKTIDADLIAELVAIKHLIFNKRVTSDFSNSCCNGLKLYTSRKVKELLQSKRIESHLFDYMDFMKTQMYGYTIADRYPGYVKFFDEKIECVNQKNHFCDSDLLRTYKLGSLRISYHAIQRYIEKINPTSKNPIEDIKRFLKLNRLKTAEIPEKIRLQKLLKYKTEFPAETWVDPISFINFVILRNAADGVGTVTTTYRR